MSPMCQYSAKEGMADHWHLVHLGSRAVGGAALVIAEATAVTAAGRISPGCLGIWSDEHISPLRSITDFIKANGSVPGIQLAHAGRKASCAVPWAGGQQLTIEEGGWETIAPSAIPFAAGDRAPTAMSQDVINTCIQDFAAAANRAHQAGFQVIELHAAHGYLLHEFLSPLSNQRTDKYGGSFENRIRFLLEILDAVKRVWPSNLPIFLRVSATDWIDNGWTEEDTVRLAQVVKELGVDLIDCSTGGNVGGVKIPLVPGYQVPFATAAKATGILTGAVGLITTAQQANSIIAEEKADMVFMAREFLRDPYFPLHAALELGIEVEWPKQYVRAAKR